MLMTGGATTYRRRHPHGIPQRTIERALPDQAYLQIKGRFSCGITSQQVLPAPDCSFFLFVRHFHR
jgi:hypothetical protein